MPRASGTTARTSGTIVESTQQQLKKKGSSLSHKTRKAKVGEERSVRVMIPPTTSDVDSLLIVRVPYDQRDKHVDKHRLRYFPSGENS